jgi:hypothetical protein
MKTFTRTLDALGIRAMPWVTRAYLALFILLVFLLLVAVIGPIREGPLPGRLFDLAADGLKTVLGAVVGSLSVAGRRGGKGAEPTAATDPRKDRPRR